MSVPQYGHRCQDERKPVFQYRGTDIGVSLRIQKLHYTEDTSSIPVERMLEIFYRWCRALVVLSPKLLPRTAYNCISRRPPRARN